MNRRMALGLALPIAVALAAPVSAKPKAGQADRIVDQFHRSMKEGNAAAVAALLDDAAIIYEQGGVEASKDEYVSGHLPGDIAYSAGMTDTVVGQHRIDLGDAVVLMRESRTTGQHQGKSVNRLGTETMVVKLTKAGWRIVHIHWSSRAPG